MSVFALRLHLSFDYRMIPTFNQTVIYSLLLLSIFSHFYVIPVFVWVLTLAIVFALQLIKPVVSLLTFIKGTLLLGTVSILILNKCKFKPAL